MQSFMQFIAKNCLWPESGTVAEDGKLAGIENLAGV